MLHGEELSAAYASADVFLMPRPACPWPGPPGRQAWPAGAPAAAALRPSHCAPLSARPPLPSLCSETETLGFVVLEAMAAGLPVVAVSGQRGWGAGLRHAARRGAQRPYSVPRGHPPAAPQVRAGGIPDILARPGVTGYLYEPGDYGSAAALTARLASEPELRARVGAAAREEVRRGRGWAGAPAHSPWVARFGGGGGVCGVGWVGGGCPGLDKCPCPPPPENTHTHTLIPGQVSLWDWRAATQHLLRVQYPLAMAAAARFYGSALGRQATAAAAAAQQQQVGYGGAPPAAAAA